MKTTLRWLNDFVDLPTDDPDEIALVLDNLGLAVEAVEAVAAPFAGVIVGKVVALRPHPDADKIRLATVDTGAGDVEVVCGAWNFDVGDVIAFSPPGSTLRDPEGRPFKVDERKIRGINSPGMICSLRELGLGTDHEGILVLDDDAPVGAEFASLLPFPDTVFDIEVTPNRPDAMSTLGIARDLAAHYDLPLREPDIRFEERGDPATVTVTLDDPEGCPRFTAREVRGLSVGPSPLWMRLRLEACGVRAINNVVDVSNYVMLELGHPNHVFDKTKLGDTIAVRRARPGEQITTLDEVVRILDPADIVVADADSPVGIGGVMGGGDSEVGADTTDVVVEAAYFDPPSVLLTAKRHGLHTEASSRFQRGMDPNNAERANRRVAQLLVEHAGATVAPDAVDAYPKPIEPWHVDLPLGEIGRVMGTTFDSASATDYLTRLGFEVEGADPLHVTVPTRRPDVTQPVDLIEEIARLHGYNNFGDSISMGTGGGLPQVEQRLRKLRHVLVGAGYSEAITFSFVGQADLDRLALPADDLRRNGIEVVNPLRDEEGVMRTTLLPGLLKAAANNVGRRVPDVRLFEVAKVFLPDPGAELPAQPESVGWVMAGPQGGSWHEPAREPDVLDATGLWEVIAATMGIGDVEVRQASPPAFHPERAGELQRGGTVVGVVGEIHPKVAEAFGLSGRVAAGEVRLDLAGVTPGSSFARSDEQPAADAIEVPVLDPGPAAARFSPPSPYPPVIFDLAFDLADDVPAGQLLRTVQAAAGPMLERLHVFDVFRGRPLAEGRKSIAVRLTFRAPDRTLTDEEVGEPRRTIAAAVASELGGTLRGAGA